MGSFRLTSIIDPTSGETVLRHPEPLPRETRERYWGKLREIRTCPGAGGGRRREGDCAPPACSGDGTTSEDKKHE